MDKMSFIKRLPLKKQPPMPTAPSAPTSTLEDFIVEEDPNVIRYHNIETLEDVLLTLLMHVRHGSLKSPGYVYPLLSDYVKFVINGTAEHAYTQYEQNMIRKCLGFIIDINIWLPAAEFNRIRYPDYDPDIVYNRGRGRGRGRIMPNSPPGSVYDISQHFKISDDEWIQVIQILQPQTNINSLNKSIRTADGAYSRWKVLERIRCKMTEIPSRGNNYIMYDPESPGTSMLQKLNYINYGEDFPRLEDRIMSNRELSNYRKSVFESLGIQIPNAELFVNVPDPENPKPVFIAQEIRFPDAAPASAFPHLNPQHPIYQMNNPEQNMTNPPEQVPEQTPAEGVPNLDQDIRTIGNPPVNDRIYQDFAKYKMNSGQIKFVSNNAPQKWTLAINSGGQTAETVRRFAYEYNGQKYINWLVIYVFHLNNKLPSGIYKAIKTHFPQNPLPNLILPNDWTDIINHP